MEGPRTASQAQWPVAEDQRLRAASLAEVRPLSTGSPAAGVGVRASPCSLLSQYQPEPWGRSNRGKKNHTLKGEHLPLTPACPSYTVPPALKAQPHCLQDTRARAHPSGNRALGGGWGLRGGRAKPEASQILRQKEALRGWKPVWLSRGPRAWTGGGTSHSHCGQAVQLRSDSSGGYAVLPPPARS